MEKTHNKKGAPALLIIGPFPPPVHGFAVITDAMAKEIELVRPVVRIDVSSSAGSSWARHLEQLWKNVLAVYAILKHYLLDRGREVSIGANAGWGMVYTLAQVAVARACKFRIVMHHHSYNYINTPSILMKWIVNVGGRSQEHVFLADKMMVSFRSLYLRAVNGHVLNNAMFVSERNAGKKRGETFSVGMLSNLSREKGLYDFLKIATIVKERGLHVQMLLAGPAYVPADRAAIEWAAERGELKWMGPLYGDKKFEFLENLDLFLFPTHYKHEAQPTVIYEAFASGVPVLAINKGAIEQQIRSSLPVVSDDGSFVEVAIATIQRLSTHELSKSDLRNKVSEIHNSDAAAARSTLRQIYEPLRPRTGGC